MATNRREHKSQRFFYALILGLLMAYGTLKAVHIAVAMDAYEGQVLSVDTKGAAK